jgi:hypothetical protein
MSRRTLTGCDHWDMPSEHDIAFPRLSRPK